MPRPIDNSLKLSARSRLRIDKTHRNPRGPRNQSRPMAGPAVKVSLMGTFGFGNSFITRRFRNHAAFVCPYASQLHSEDVAAGASPLPQ